jgi:hypothetical protein
MLLKDITEIVTAISFGNLSLARAGKEIVLGCLVNVVLWRGDRLCCCLFRTSASSIGKFSLPLLLLMNLLESYICCDFSPFQCELKP